PGPDEHELTARALDFDGRAVISKPVHVLVSVEKKALRATIARIDRMTDGKVQLVLHGDPAKIFYDVEVSSDLMKWKKAGEFTPGNLSFFYLDETAQSVSPRFYRAVERSAP